MHTPSHALLHPSTITGCTIKRTLVISMHLSSETASGLKEAGPLVNRSFTQKHERKDFSKKKIKKFKEKGHKRFQFLLYFQVNFLGQYFLCPDNGMATSVFVMFSVCTDVDACDHTKWLYKQCKSSHLRFSGRKFPFLALGNWIHISIAPGFSIRHSIH